LRIKKLKYISTNIKYQKAYVSSSTWIQKIQKESSSIPPVNDDKTE
jgi:hypothetical protein